MSEVINNPLLEIKLNKAQAREALWRKGSLSFLLDRNQKELYDLYYNTNHKVQTWLLARRSGKSYALCVLAIETCLRTPNVIVKFLSPTNKQLSTNIRPLMKKILENCPSDLRPEHKKQDNIYFFPNGSELQLSGTDGGSAERIRGGDAWLAIVDEAGSCSDLKNCVQDILLPSTLTVNGKIILASTPPEDSEHDFLYFIEEAEQRGSIVIKTIDDNPRITQQQKDDLIKELGGKNSDTSQRELYCKIVKSQRNSIIPEFTEEKAKTLVKEMNVPPFYDCYVSMDLGYKDWTVVLFGYYDFRIDKVIIQDEIVTYGNDMYLDKLGNDILKKEKDLWTSATTGEAIKPKKRIADNNLVAVNEIKRATNYQVTFQTADKNEKLAGINFAKIMINNEKVLINPRCKTLIAHLKNGRWASASNKDTFARCPNGSHYDAIDALVYLLKAIDFKHNPYPKNYDMNLKEEDLHYNYNKDNKINNEGFYRRLLNLKSNPKNRYRMGNIK